MDEKEILATKLFNFMSPKFESDPYIKLACEKKGGATIEGILRIMKKQLWKRDLASLQKIDQRQEDYYFHFRRCFVEISLMGDLEILTAFRKEQKQAQMN